MSTTVTVHLTAGNKITIPNVKDSRVGANFLTVNSERGFHRFDLRQVNWHSELQDVPVVEVQFEPKTITETVQRANYVVIVDDNTPVLKNRTGGSGAGLPENTLLDGVVFMSKATARGNGWRVR